MTHFGVSVVGYALVVPLAHLLSVVNDQRQRSCVAFITTLLVCPARLPYPSLAIVRTGSSVGLSGMFIPLHRYFLLAIAGHAELTFGVGKERRTDLLLFLLA